MKIRRYISVILALILLLALSAPAFAADGDKDVLTRGEFISALYKASGADAAKTQDYFTDVPASGALAQAIRWAVENRIVSGYGRGRFGPDDPVTREQMAAILYRNAQALGLDPQGEWMFPLGFADAGDISAYAEKGMEWAVMNRILIGTGKGVAPGAEATQAQLDLVIERWQDFLAGAQTGRGIYILYTSDVHCGIDQGFGYAGLWEVKNALEAQGYDVILVDNGDSVNGEAIGTTTKGLALISLMNKLGYDLAAIGNHEFDFGMDSFLALAESAEFTYVSCNFVHEGEPVFAPYFLCELGGKKIAFVGVSTPETIIKTAPTYFMDETGRYVYSFLQDDSGAGVYDAVQDAADAARAEGADYVVVLAHLGKKDESIPWTSGLLISHTTGIDAVLDGHSHDTEQMLVPNASGVLIPRGGCGTKMEGIGWCHIAPDGALYTGLYRWQRDAAAPALLGLDNVMTRAVAEATDELNKTMKTVIAHTAAKLTIHDPDAVDEEGKPVRVVRRQETNLGDLCADAYRDQAGADIAILNGGAVRVNLGPGDITLNDIFNLMPFGNALCMIEATGQMILDALEWGAHKVPAEYGGFLQVSGLSYEIHSYIPSPCIAAADGTFLGIEGERRVKNVLVAGVPIDPEKTYTLAAHDYMLLNGGDGFTMFGGAEVLLDSVKLDNQLLIDHLTETLNGEIGEAYADPRGQGRIVIVDQAPED